MRERVSDEERMKKGREIDERNNLLQQHAGSLNQVQGVHTVQNVS